MVCDSICTECVQLNHCKLKDFKDVWVYLHHEQGVITKSSLELLSIGRSVSNNLKQKLVGVLLGYQLGDLVKQPIMYGADKTIYSDEIYLKNYICLPYTTALTQMVEHNKPNVFLFVSDEIGKDLTPRVASRLKTGLATDNIDLKIENYYYPPSKTTFKNLLIQVRPDFATRIARIYTPKHRPQIATVRPGNFDLPKRSSSRRGKVTEFKIDFTQDDFSIVIKELKSISTGETYLEKAQAVVAIGLGILRDAQGNPKDPSDGYELAKELAKVIREKYGWVTAIGSSRALIYAELKNLNGLITHDNQVGQTGTTVNPDIYFAIGISGAVQHKVGMQRTKKIVAVNIDPNAPIFDIAHYPIIGDLYQEVPKLIQAIRGS